MSSQLSLFRLIRRCIGIGLILFGCMGASPTLQADSVPPPAPLDASTATAAYLLNFIRFTEWPASVEKAPASVPFVIGVSGDRELLDSLIRLTESENVRGRSLRVIRLKSPDDLLVCQVAYFETTGPQDDTRLRISTALVTTRGQPILTVSTAADFIADGGMIQLFNEDKRLRFSISADAARAAGLTINSRLLALSRRPANAH